MKANDPTPANEYRGLLILMIVLNLMILGWVVLPRLEPFGLHLGDIQPVRAWFGDATARPDDLKRPETSESETPLAASTVDPNEAFVADQGIVLLAMRDGNFSHLFAYQPAAHTLSRLTDSPWDEITPAVSPDGTHIAYSARQNGYWDLYLLDLTNGQQTRITDTPDYEASPTWSPDGQWLAYERYNGVSLDIYLQSLSDLQSSPIQLTDDPGIDRSPVWSPGGRQIAFVSTRSGEKEIWLADLDQADQRFSNLSRQAAAEDDAPAWSSDGQRLSWAVNLDGDQHIEIWNPQEPQSAAQRISDGSQSIWESDHQEMLTLISAGNEIGLAGYDPKNGRLTSPYFSLPGEVYGMTWVSAPLPDWLAKNLQPYPSQDLPELWQPKQTQTVFPAGRTGLSALDEVAVEQALLSDVVDEGFVALRQQAAVETGWDVLYNLENAYLPLNAPPPPSIQDDWLYTGRAFAINPLLASAGWLVISPENINGQIYWRVYLKARYQDGSMGKPLGDLIWDTNARYSGDPRAYEQGGASAAAPSGFWIDLTELAHRYGWQRLPALTNWRTFYPAMRFNQFVITGGLSWDQAMAELYPPEALMTITPLPSQTPSRSTTSHAIVITSAPTLTPTATAAPTRRPTWTPLASPQP